MENIHLDIIYDPAQEREGFLTLGERHEILPDGDWISAARRALKDPSLFLYYHKREGTYVLASLIWEGVCQELQVYPLHPGREDHPRASIEYLRKRMRPVREHLEGMKRSIRERQYQERQLRGERIQARQDASRHLRRKGLGQAARQIDEGYVPFTGQTEGGERLAELKEHLSFVSKRL
jgi:hypothetical protein